jgi:hypothetical protein
MGSANDLTGWRSGALVALTRVDNDSFGKAQWACKCDCGGAHIVRASHLASGRVTHCLACNLETNELRLDAWYHVTVYRDGGGATQGSAGFVVAMRGNVELMPPVWIEERQISKRQPIVLAQTIRALAKAGHIRCKTDTPSVRAWIKRNKGKITHHSFNEGEQVWGEWFRRTGEWKGPELK